MAKKWFSFLWTAIILALLVYVLWGVNFYEVYDLIASANILWFILAVVAMFFTYIVWNWRWQYIFRPVFRGDWGFMMHVLLAGSFFTTVTPGAGVGGEPFRAHFLSKKYNKPVSQVFGYVLGDKFFHLIVLGMFVIFSVFFILIYVQISDALTYILEAVLVIVVGLSTFVLYLVFKKSHFNIGAFLKRLHAFRFIKKYFKTAEEFEIYVNKRIKSFLTIFRKVLKNKNNLIVGLLLSILFWLLFYLSAYFLFLSFGKNMNFLSVIIVVTLGQIIGSLSAVPGGVGVVETSMTILYSAMGVTTSLALLVSFLFRIIQYFYSLFIGGMSLVHIRRKTNGRHGFF